MSEMTRHEEATAVEEVRHAEAGEAEMAAHVGYSPPSLLEVQKTQADAKRALSVAFIVGGLVIVLALTLAGVSVLARNSEAISARHASQDNGRRIDELTKQLNDAKTVLGSFNAKDSAISLCESKYTARVSDAGRETLVDQAQLIILIATVVPTERPTVIGTMVSNLTAASQGYREASLARSAWIDGGKQLPCPI